MAIFVSEVERALSPVTVNPQQATVLSPVKSPKEDADARKVCEKILHGDICCTHILCFFHFSWVVSSITQTGY